jgi:hypothetical protein
LARLGRNDHDLPNKQGGDRWSCKYIVCPIRQAIQKKLKAMREAGFVIQLVITLYSKPIACIVDHFCAVSDPWLHMSHFDRISCDQLLGDVDQNHGIRDWRADRAAKPGRDVISESHPTHLPALDDVVLAIGTTQSNRLRCSLPFPDEGLGHDGSRPVSSRLAD